MNIIRVVPNALTIDLDLVSVQEMVAILKRNPGYVDGDSRRLVIFGKK